jgi:hypothetical protein
VVSYRKTQKALLSEVLINEKNLLKDNIEYNEDEDIEVKELDDEDEDLINSSDLSILSRPGDKITSHRRLRFFNIYCYISTLDEYKKKLRRASSKTYTHGFEISSKKSNKKEPLVEIIKRMNEDKY